MQADTVLEKELRILRQQKETVCHFRQSLNIGDLRSPLPKLQSQACDWGTRDMKCPSAHTPMVFRPGHTKGGPGVGIP